MKIRDSFVSNSSSSSFLIIGDKPNMPSVCRNFAKLEKTWVQNILNDDTDLRVQVVGMFNKPMEQIIKENDFWLSDFISDCDDDYFSISSNGFVYADGGCGEPYGRYDEHFDKKWKEINEDVFIRVEHLR